MRRFSARALAVLAGCIGCAGILSCSAIADAVDQAACGAYGTATLTTTLTAQSPEFYIATPANAKTGGPSCETEFTLTWGWADTARARQSTSPPGLTNLAEVFQVELGFSYFPYTMTPTRTGAYDWYLTHSDHDSGNGATTTYSMTTGLVSTAAADSVTVTGTIDYYY